ncbi:NAD(P)-dependent oxidoreductase [Alphaproteobacteria bacterium]|nr:NAD(P)-dependent oxidoreductase [Alphaproteobacteria bacterium]
MNKASSFIPMSDIRLRNERIMLVGGMGFIGHHLALSLKRAGADVLVVDNLQINNIVKILSDPELDEIRRSLYLNFITERFDLLRRNGIKIQSADARNMAEFSYIFDKFKPTKAVHLAAISSAVVANKHPNLAYDIQINSLRNLLSLCQMDNSSCKHVCFMSSSTVYGDFEGDSVDETVRPQPKGVYANGKYIGERMVREAFHLYGVNYTIIRPSALYGVRCISGRVSQKFIENALFGKPLLLEGGGGGMLDFTHIEDLVEGITRSLALEGGLNRTFNITFGNARSIADLAQIIKEVVPSATVENAPPAPEKPKRGTLLTQRARDFLGFVPSRSIDTGYRDFCEWYYSKWQNASEGV